MGSASLLRRAGIRALRNFHSFAGARHKSSSRDKRTAALRAAAIYAVDALEQRQLLTVTSASIMPPTENLYENTALAFSLAASSDQGAVTGWNIDFGDGTGVQNIPGETSSVSHTFPAIATYNITAIAYDESGGAPTPDDGSGLAASAQVQVQDAPLTASGASISQTIGQAWSGTVATFNDPDPDAQASLYTAVVNWGDGTTSTSTISSSVSGGGNFVVSDSHTYTALGTFSPVVNIVDSGGSSVTVTDSATVSLPWMSVSTPGSPTLQENQAYSNIGLGSLNWYDPGAGISYSVTTNFGASVSIDAYGDLSGSGTAPAVGSYAGWVVSVTQSYDAHNDTESTAPFGATVQDAPLTAAPINISAKATIPWTGTVATFTDADPNAQASEYTAIISYADGRSAGTITADGSGGFIVTSTLTFSTPGNSSPTVTISDGGGSAVTATDGAAVTFSSLSLSAPALYIEQGQAYSGNIGLLTDAAGSYSNSADFTGSITWDGWTYGNLTLSSAGTGAWNVQGNSMATLPAGTYTGTLAITETIGSQSLSVDPVNFTINVIPPNLYAAGGYMSATVGAPWSGTVATIADDDSYDLPTTYYTAATNFGDGSSLSASQISAASNPGSWTVTDTHTFTAAGTFSPVTTISDLGHNAVASATSTAGVSLAQISLYSADQWLQNDQAPASTIGTLTDAAGSYATGNYSGTLALTPSGSTTGQSFSIYFVHNSWDAVGVYDIGVSMLPSLYTGTCAATIAASETDSQGQSVDASSTFIVNVADGPITAQPASINSTAGTSWTGTVAAFTQYNPYGAPSTYSASIDYNDGSAPSIGTISADGSGGWIVTGSHTFASVGNYSPTVTINDAYGGTTTASDSAQVGPAGPPSLLNANAISANAIDLAWTDPDASSSIEIDRSTGSSGSFIALSTLAPGTVIYHDGLDHRNGILL